MIIPSIPINALMFSNHSVLFSWHECRFLVFFINLHEKFSTWWRLLVTSVLWQCPQIVIQFCRDAMHSKNTRVNVTRKWVHRGRTQSKVKSYPEFVHLSADLNIKMSNWPSAGSYSTASWLISRSSLTPNWVWPQWTLSGSRLTPVFLKCVAFSQSENSIYIIESLRLGKIWWLKVKCSLFHHVTNPRVHL